MWAITGGHVPAISTGPEPQNTSRDVVCILNPNDTTASISITIYYASREPSLPYEVIVAARRMRNIRFNDLIDPEAIPLETDFACIAVSDVPVIVGFSKVDTSSGIVLSYTTAALPLQ